MMAWFARGASIALSALLLYPGTGGPGEPLPASGVPFLSLPFSLGREPDPLDGWEEFAGHGVVADPRLAPVEEVTMSVAIAGPLEQPDLPVELFGHVNEGDLQVFCFFDRRSSRWFRIAAGGRDSKARVALLEAGKHGWPLVLDLSTGRRYRMQPGQNSLIPCPPEGVLTQP